MMIVRLGYVAMTLNLKDASPSKTVTFKTYSNINNDEGRKHRLEKITRANLENTLRILRYNLASDISVYRFTSKLVPLATHLDVPEWSYEDELHDEFKAIGDIVKENDFRVSAHPDHYTVINSPNEDVFKASLRDLEYHFRIFKAMGLDDKKYKLILHIGGLYGKKDTSIQRFIDRFKILPEYIQNKIIIENDDKSYNAIDVLNICNELSVPMVFDVHHHYCNNNGQKISDLLPSIYQTWKNEYFCPKIHFSSPKSEKKFRHHADNIVFDDFMNFIDVAKEINHDIDIMLEAKNKDNALFNLMEQLKQHKKVSIINQATFEY